MKEIKRPDRVKIADELDKTQIVYGSTVEREYLNRLEKYCNQLEHQNEELKKDNEHLYQSLNDRRKICDKLEAQNKELKEEIEKLNEKIKLLKISYDSFIESNNK